MKCPFRLVAVGSLLGLALISCEQPTANGPVHPQAPVASVTGGGLQTFSVRGTFETQFHGLPMETFEAAIVSDGTIKECPGPVDAANNNACFSLNAIQPGVHFNSDHPEGGKEILLLGAHAIAFGLPLGNPTKNIVANFFNDAFVITFTAGNVTAVGMDLVAFIDPDNCVIDVFGANSPLTSAPSPCTHAGALFGVSSPLP